MIIYICKREISTKLERDKFLVVDRSTDSTADIVRQYASTIDYGFISLIFKDGDRYIISKNEYNRDVYVYWGNAIPSMTVLYGGEDKYREYWKKIYTTETLKYGFGAFLETPETPDAVIKKVVKNVV